MNEIDEFKKAVLVFLSGLKELGDKGLIVRDGPRDEISPQGLAMADQLVADGFKLTEKHVGLLTAYYRTSNRR
jgi:hypothetical protein